MKEKLKKTGAFIVASTMALTITVFSQLNSASALENNILLSKLETGASLTTDELNRALKDANGQEIIEKNLNLGKNINYYTDIKSNNTIQDIELEVSLKNNFGNDVLIEYTGIEADTSQMPVKFYYNYKISEDPSKLEKGLDVSAWQGEINWDETSKHVDFAIIRVMDAICRDANGNYALDEQFHRNMQECERLNIPVGVYWYSRATTEEEARREANFVGQVLNDYTLEYPVYIDVECESQLSLDDQTLRNVISAANTEIAKYNLYPAIYINNSHAHRVESLPYKLW